MTQHSARLRDHSHSHALSPLDAPEIKVVVAELYLGSEQDSRLVHAIRSVSAETIDRMSEKLDLRKW